MSEERERDERDFHQMSDVDGNKADHTQQMILTRTCVSGWKKKREGVLRRHLFHIFFGG